MPNNGGQAEFAIPAGSTIYLSTGTADKIYDFQMGQEAQNLPLRFRPFSALAELCNSPVEDGGRYEVNVGKKGLSTLNAFQQLFKHVHELDEYRHFYTERLGMNLNKPVYVANEDSGYGLRLPVEFFKYFDETGIAGHMDKIRKSLEDEEDPEKKDITKYCFPGVETGPILRDCGGEPEFFRRVREALDRVAQERAKKTGAANFRKVKWQEEIPVKCFSTLLIREIKPGFSDKGRVNGANGHSANQASELTLTDSVSGVINFSPSPPSRVYSSDHYIFSDNFQQSFADLEHPAFHYTSMLSARARVLQSLQKYIVGKVNGNGRQSNGIMQRGSNGLASGQASRFCVGLLNHEQGHAQTQLLRESMREAMRGSSGFDFISPSIQASDSLGWLNREVIDAADAFVLMPPNGAKPGEITAESARQVIAANAAMLFHATSLIVAKQLEARCFDKPIIIYDEGGQPNHSYSAAAVDALSDLLQRKLMGGRVGEHEDFTGKPLVADPRNLIDICYSKEQLVELLKKRAGRYQQYDTPPLLNDGEMVLRLRGHKPRHIRPASEEEPVIPHGEPSRRFNVAVFCSAASENTQNLEMTSDLSYLLARNGYGVICGAGDRYMMGSIAEGVQRWRDEYATVHVTLGEGAVGDQRDGWIGGSSTPVILGKETMAGNIPHGYNQFYLAPNIYKRMEYFGQSSDAFIVMEGGAGTLQEFTGLLQRKLMGDSNFVSPQNDGANPYDKPFILVNNALHGKPGERAWEKSLIALLGASKQCLTEDGKDVSACLTKKDEETLKHAGIFVVSTVQQAMDVVETHRKLHPVYGSLAGNGVATHENASFNLAI